MAAISDNISANQMETDTNPVAARATEEPTNLMVNYLPHDMQEQELGDLFISFGALRSVRIVRDFVTGQSKSYGFVDFLLASNARQAQAFLNGRNVRDKTMRVAFARPSSEAIQKSKLYVANLPTHYTESQILNMFGGYGNIMEVKILRDKNTTIPRGVAFVRYELGASAEMAIAEMHGSVLEDGLKPLVVKLAHQYTFYS